MKNSRNIINPTGGFGSEQVSWNIKQLMDDEPVSYQSSKIKKSQRQVRNKELKASVAFKGIHTSSHEITLSKMSYNFKAGFSFLFQISMITYGKEGRPKVEKHEPRCKTQTVGDFAWKYILWSSEFPWINQAECRLYTSTVHSFFHSKHFQPHGVLAKPATTNLSPSTICSDTPCLIRFPAAAGQKDRIEEKGRGREGETERRRRRPLCPPLPSDNKI